MMGLDAEDTPPDRESKPRRHPVERWPFFFVVTAWGWWRVLTMPFRTETGAEQFVDWFAIFAIVALLSLVLFARHAGKRNRSTTDVPS